ncbi:MAG: hypothetical protein ABIQ33_13075 [Caldimonas sp.]
MQTLQIICLNRHLGFPPLRAESRAAERRLIARTTSASREPGCSPAKASPRCTGLRPAAFAARVEEELGRWKQLAVEHKIVAE